MRESKSAMRVRAPVLRTFPGTRPLALCSVQRSEICIRAARSGCQIGFVQSQFRNALAVRCTAREANTMVPKLSDEAWALLGIIHRASHGGPLAPAGFVSAYAELQAHRLAFGLIITSKGEAALRERYLESDEFSPLSR